MDPATHKRFLDYRERHGYFGRHVPALDMTRFVEADREHRALAAKPEGARSEQEQTRLEELAHVLLVD